MSLKIFPGRCCSALLYLLTVTVTGGLPSMGQAPGLSLSNDVVDFGKIATITYIPKTVEFTNVSSEKLAILLVEKTPEVTVRFERIFYAPGEKGLITLTCEPKTTGKFEQYIYIHTNLGSEPYPVRLKGEVVSITECFPDPANLLKRTIQVIDRETKLPVDGAGLRLVHNHNYNKPLDVKVSREGKAVREMPIGLYHITAEASGYEPLVTEVFVPKSQPLLILELDPVRKAPSPPAKPLPQGKPAITLPAMEVTSDELPENQYAANNLIFLLDVSTSMKSGKKFLLLQQSVNNLAMILRPIDQVSVITYSNDASVVLTGVNGGDKEHILNTIQDLQPYGITRGVKGLNTAYELARANFIRGGNNQIILMTDGEFSEKGLDDSYYTDMLTRHASEGISISILGFGVNQEAIDRMELMCRAGNGSFILVKSGEYVRDALIDEVKSKSFIGK